jgi:hypothetical protein
MADQVLRVTGFAPLRFGLYPLPDMIFFGPFDPFSAVKWVKEFHKKQGGDLDEQYLNRAHGQAVHGFSFPKHKHLSGALDFIRQHEHLQPSDTLSDSVIRTFRETLKPPSMLSKKDGTTMTREVELEWLKRSTCQRSSGWNQRYHFS